MSEQSAERAEAVRAGPAHQVRIIVQALLPPASRAVSGLAARRWAPPPRDTPRLDDSGWRA